MLVLLYGSLAIFVVFLLIATVIFLFKTFLKALLLAIALLVAYGILRLIVFLSGKNKNPH